MVLDGDDRATSLVPRVSVDLTDAPVIQDGVFPAIPIAVALMRDGDPDDVAPEIPWEDVLVIPAPATPSDVTSMISVAVIPGGADPWSEWYLNMSLGLITRFSSYEIRNGYLSVSSGEGEIHTRGRGGCPRCSLGVFVVGGLVDA